MSIKIIDEVWKFSQHKGSALLVLLAIADYSDESGKSWPSVQTIAEKVKLSERYVQILNRKIEISGEIEVVSGKCFGKWSNIYLIKVRKTSAADTSSSNDEPFISQGVNPALTGEPRLTHGESHLTPGVRPALHPNRYLTIIETS